MAEFNNFLKFTEFRKKYPYFIYEGFNLYFHNDTLTFSYDFDLANEYRFQPVYNIPLNPLFDKNKIKSDSFRPILENMVFHIGMIELISYWKAACPPKVIIKTAKLDDYQQRWWKDIWFHGLGEFFYTNNIKTDPDSFLSLAIKSEKEYPPFTTGALDGYLVPVGGGKDSTVTLEILNRHFFKVVPFSINPREAVIKTIEASNSTTSPVYFERNLDKQLLDLNKKGFLNGHTPFSALVAFNSLPAAVFTGIQNIALSNESSANEATIPGTNINHQYSKTYEFEEQFRNYVKKYITEDINYFSFLRPLSELQIGKLFSKFSGHFKAFRSCNAGSKKGVWCGKCAKCLFTYIILSPYMDDNTLAGIFGKNLFDDPDLKPLLDELSGLSDIKPFECIGTIDEVNMALTHTIKKRHVDDLPPLLEYFKGTANYSRYADSELNQFNEQFDPDHNLTSLLLNILKQSLDE